MIDTVVMVTGSYGCNTFRGEPRFVVRVLLEFFLEYKILYLRKIHSETTAAVFKAVCLKNAERVTPAT